MLVKHAMLDRILEAMRGFQHQTLLHDVEEEEESERTEREKREKKHTDM